MNGPTQVGFEKLSDLLDDIEEDPWLDFSRSGSGSSIPAERFVNDNAYQQTADYITFMIGLRAEAEPFPS